MFGRKCKIDDVYLITDIRSESVGVALIRVAEDGKPDILVHERKELALQNEFDGGNLVPKISLSLLQLLTEIQNKNRDLKPCTAYCVLCSPWYSSQSRVVKYKSDNEFVVSKDLVRRLVDEEVKYYKLDYYPNKDVALVEMREMETRLNGYKTNSPYDKVVTELEMSIYVSVADTSVLNEVKDKIAKVFHMDDITFHSFPYAGLSMVPDLVGSTSSDYIFADINGEISEFSIVKAGVVVENASFPLGSHAIPRMIGKKLGVSAFQGDALFKAYKSKQVSRKISEAIEVSLMEIRATWAGEVKKMFGNLSKNYLLPENFIIAGSPSIVPLFCECINEGDISKMTKKHGPLAMTILLPEYLERFIKSSIGDELDTFLSMSAVYVAKLIATDYNTR